ncbi:unnamed protein product [Mycena citricolor]|uniref:CCHC-type domain-containing protein n=1 Tax=Mycena citricolor TaxID=2018698 RepID=A0AAD2K4L3_9AGAR|nr:unnamed protein product [Mycena citricolor]
MPTIEITPFSGRRDGTNMLTADWVRAVRQAVTDRQYATTEEQIRAVNYHLKPDSPAEDYMLGLTATSPARASLDAYLDELKATFPGLKPIRRTAASYEAELLKTRITVAELAAETVRRGEVEVYVQEDFANQVEDLAIQARVKDTLAGYPLWKENQPSIIVKALKPDPASWADVAARIRAIANSDIHELAEGHRATANTLREQQLLKANINDLTRSFSALRLPPASPAAAAIAPKQAQAPPATSRLQNATQQDRPRQAQFERDYTPTADEVMQIRAAREKCISLAQPDTPQGRTTYNQQRAAWATQHDAARLAGTQRLWETGYPLAPGTQAPCSRECWKCGYPRHGSGECTAPFVPGDERRFRYLCHTWLGQTRAAPATVPVNVVDWTSIGAPTEEDLQDFRAGLTQ